MIFEGNGMLDAIQAMVWEVIVNTPGYEDPGCAGKYICWSVLTSSPRLKVKSVQYEIWFDEDRARLLMFAELPCGEFPYADPGFPDTLYARLPRVEVKS